MKYTIFLLHGGKLEIEGNDAVSAFNNAGIGRGALKAIDFYAEEEDAKKYEWNPKTKNWDNTELNKIIEINGE
jgi:hypothetical protein